MYIKCLVEHWSSLGTNWNSLGNISLFHELHNSCDDGHIHDLAGYSNLWHATLVTRPRGNKPPSCTLVEKSFLISAPLEVSVRRLCMAYISRENQVKGNQIKYIIRDGISGNDNTNSSKVFVGAHKPIGFPAPVASIHVYFVYISSKACRFVWSP